MKYLFLGAKELNINIGVYLNKNTTCFDQSEPIPFALLLASTFLKALI